MTATVEPFNYPIAAIEVVKGDVLYDGINDSYQTVMAVLHLEDEVRLAMSEGALIRVKPLDPLVIRFTP